MGAAEMVLLLTFIGALFIIGFSILIGINIGKKQGEIRCPYCREPIQKGASICRWCGKEIPAEGNS